jgi:hypothetical protein
MMLPAHSMQATRPCRFARLSSDHGGSIRKCRRIWPAIMPACSRPRKAKPCLIAPRPKPSPNSVISASMSGPAAKSHTDNFVLHMHKSLTGLEIDGPQADDVFDYDHAKIIGKTARPTVSAISRPPARKESAGGRSRGPSSGALRSRGARSRSARRVEATSPNDYADHQSRAPRNGRRGLSQCAARRADLRRGS